ncbi:hypothetical protein BaRGS_00008132 [Batillaria attramentaria]|uniref:Uncharacterized protein n=1 Tax=Batillaria attramentaria TaxID=370345 RepID=A0ABD0LMG5_9CAEN
MLGMLTWNPLRQHYCQHCKHTPVTWHDAADVNASPGRVSSNTTVTTKGPKPTGRTVLECWHPDCDYELQNRVKERPTNSYQFTDSSTEILSVRNRFCTRDNT